jgi:hypothetical protein
MPIDPLVEIAVESRVAHLNDKPIRKSREGGGMMRTKTEDQVVQPVPLGKVPAGLARCIHETCVSLGQPFDERRLPPLHRMVRHQTGIFTAIGQHIFGGEHPAAPCRQGLATGSLVHSM